MAHETWIWSWGAGTRGQLASAASSDSLEPLRLSSFANARPVGDGSTAFRPCASSILDMACGGAHAAALLREAGEEHAQVVTWGNGESGALGHGKELGDVSAPKIVELFHSINVCSLAAGWSHTAFVTECGELYTCGSGSFGQLGHGDCEERLLPCKVQSLSSRAVVKAACGMRHTLVLTDTQGTHAKSAVYSFGASRRGQLGLAELDVHGTERLSSQKIVKVSIPQEIKEWTGNQVVELAANGDHSAAITDEDVLWAWGSNQRGQLGSIEGTQKEPSPTSVENFFKEGGCRDDSVITCSADQHWPKMVRVHGLEGRKVVSLSAGSEHSAVFLEDGELKVWGWGEHGQLGLGNTDDAPIPQIVILPGNLSKNEFTWRVICGSGFTFTVGEKSSNF
ncbi:hypothetical protein AXG93_4491s1050 [Marchantia polymorpha subsp. ruderalis]|uniref:RCC1-like domain-containing protein n=1 Tax=Marchantia polymorpha subsp. ruderalis TaxID=1480154 RepID=A0A176WS28_MARPO|nr:hypothetical protein AXG93_4491s1050 [Marchantia polymorpha subsp. ruderalis]